MSAKIKLKRLLTPEKIDQIIKKEERNIFGFFIKYFLFTYLILIGIITLGLFAMFTLPKEAEPEIQIPYAFVSSFYPGANPSDTEELITNKTKGIIPVHMNGRSADMNRILEIARRNSLFVIEDAAQAIASSNADGYLGTQSDIGCFSLSVAKTIATGQGGFAVTNNAEIANRMRAIRTHGVESVKDPKCWVMPGFNFRFTDIHASIGIEQLKRLPERVQHLREIYSIYAEGLKDTPFKQIPVDLKNGEVPVYNEFLVENRSEWIGLLEQEGIETRPFYPDIDTAAYLIKKKQHFPNSRKYGLNGLYLPSGPCQPQINIFNCIEKIKGIVEK